MKTKTFFLISFLLITFQFNAQKVVALHTSGGVQFFSDENAFQSAYETAADNDTIYLPGGSFAPPASFEKKLTIYGVGHNPETTSATFMTIISGDFNISSEAAGMYLEGVQISGDITFDYNEPINDIIVKRCKFEDLNIDGDLSNPSESCIFQENIMDKLDTRNLLNSTFFNNIINLTVNEAHNLIFLNNLFLHVDCSGWTYDNTIDYANGCLFKNNIFLQGPCSNVVGGSGESTYSHNIFCASLESIILGTDPIMDSNYSMNSGDIFINYTGGSFTYEQDYHLTTAALANPGDDGTQCGIYGGYYPWKEGSIPSTPHIVSKNISNTTDESTGTIHIDINVQAQDR